MTNEELVALIQAGERDRIPELWLQVERLVRMHAYRWDRAFEGRNGAVLDDYIQAGFFGFLYAVDYYRPDRGSSFAHTLIMCIKTPFEQTAGVKTSKQRRADSYWISLDAPATPDEDSDPLVEFIEDPHGEDAFLEVEDRQLYDAVVAALDTLSAEEKKVIRLRYWDEFTLDQIAAALGQSKRYVSDVHNKALRKLRNPSRHKGLLACWRE